MTFPNLDFPSLWFAKVLKHHGLNIPLVADESLEVAGCRVALPLSCAATDCGARGAWEEDAQYVTAVHRSTGVRPTYVEVKSVSDY